ncbi:hypothetical protein PoB_007679900 [Plakobranchus ocellatus]|uniref:Secreted protein n=1 Tax=Plakobranchus ocellatus TaxID=259542 RepID=A0AAV4E203_9GAST|nr:hypothetical protein PoB_007679900 [Plakobranchus ocellatus]
MLRVCSEFLKCISSACLSFPLRAGPTLYKFNIMAPPVTNSMFVITNHQHLNWYTCEGIWQYARCALRSTNIYFPEMCIAMFQKILIFKALLC